MAMARITVEKCLQQPGMGNAFDLVLTASKRARQLVQGGESFVASEDDKPTVIALREIEAGQVTTDSVEQHFDFSQDLLREYSGLGEQPRITPVGFEDDEDESGADSERSGDRSGAGAADDDEAEDTDSAKQSAGDATDGD